LLLMPPVPRWVTSTEKPFGKLTSIESEGPLAFVLVEELPAPASVAFAAAGLVWRDSIGQFKALPLLMLPTLI
jgi:hypothetical protein